MSYQIDKVEDLTRRAVKHVFGSMLSIDLVEEPPPSLALNGKAQIAGSVGFIGDTSGVIYLYAGVDFAGAITSRMLGISEAEIEGDEMVNDAIGELSNMVGGFVKSHLCDGGSPCILTIPSIIRGEHLSIERVANVARKIIRFGHENQLLLAELLIKQSAV